MVRGSVVIDAPLTKQVLGRLAYRGMLGRRGVPDQSASGWPTTSPASSRRSRVSAGPAASTRRSRSGSRWERHLGRGGLDLPRLARRARRPRRDADPAGHLPRGVRPRRRARPGRPHRRGAARADADRVRHAPSSSSASCPRSSTAPSSGARATPSPARAPTSRTCRLGRARRRRVGASTGRRCGPRWRTWATGASCVARTEPRLAAPQRAVLSAGADGPAGRRGPARSVQMTGDREFNEVFFDDARTDADLVVGELGDGWGSPWARSPSSAASPRSASRSRSQRASRDGRAGEARTARSATR